MRDFSAAFAAHLTSGATTLATCWKLTRSDGLVLGFTDHDATVRFSALDFVPTHGLDGGEVNSKLGPQVDTAEVVGVLRSAAITDDDIVLGRYAGAVVETWRVNWRDPSVRALMRRDTIGEIVREDGMFRAELRSGQHALNVPQGRVYGALCDAELGDGRCKVELDDPAFRASVGVAAVLDRFRLQLTGLGSFDAGWFSFGAAQWTSGKRTGLRDRVTEHRREGGLDVVQFAAPVGDWTVAGDTLTLFAGCDRRLATCRRKFSNVANFRGFPHIPGNDFVLRYPRPGDRRDGRALVT